MAINHISQKQSIINFIKVSYHGDLSVNPIDILRSKEGYSSFRKDRDTISSKRKKTS